MRCVCEKSRASAISFCRGTGLRRAGEDVRAPSQLLNFAIGLWMEHGGVDCRWRRLTCADWMNSVKIVGMMLMPVPSKEQREKEALTADGAA